MNRIAKSTLKGAGYGLVPAALLFTSTMMTQNSADQTEMHSFVQFMMAVATISAAIVFPIIFGAVGLGVGLFSNDRNTMHTDGAKHLLQKNELK